MGQRPTRLELLRGRKHLSQGDLAEKSGVSRDVITAIENRRAGRRIRITTLARLADALGVELEELLEEAS